ncbi:MAG TPA: hypothetical protein VE910_04575, partial [Dongiaceae bacterium]|nr:hypothetical protein [Dongiaceae bacterium]
RVLKSPGTALGNRWRLHQIFKGQDKSYMHAIGGAPVGSGTRGGNPPDLWSTDGWCFLSPGDSKDLLSDPASQLVLDLEIFESSSQPQHMWQPEKGDLRVLWTGQLRKTLSAP